MKVETTALSIKHIAQMYCVNGKYFAGLYRNKFSGYAEWREDGLDCGFYFNSANIGPYMSPDETCLSNGEVWTFLTNKDGHGGRGTLAAAFPGTKSDEIITTLIGAMGKTPETESQRGDILKRRDHAPDTSPQQAHPDDGAKQMDRYTASPCKHSVQPLSDTERCLPSCDGTAPYIQYENLTDKSHGKNERLV